jgi:DNA replication licensing factor MCM7
MHRRQDTACISSVLLRTYLSRAKEQAPVISEGLQATIASKYVDLRNFSDTKKETRVTPRNLLALLRLATARAKLRFDSEVREEDFLEAVRLMDESKIMGLASRKIDVGETEEVQRVNKIMEIVNAMVKSTGHKEFTREEIMKRVHHRGFMESDFELYLKHGISFGWLMLTGPNTIKLT